MPSFAEMKKNREAMFTELNKQISDGQRGRKKDDRFWYPALDQTGNGFAIIRFLPAPGDEPVPYVDMWSYGFKGPGGWYINNSRTTLGLDESDPVHQSNKALRADGTKSSKAIADRRKASQSYFSNVYVVRDPQNPENEGKVFLFRFGRKIMNKIMAKMQPEYEADTKMNPFDLWEGANFRMKITTEAKTAENPKGFRNYDNSEWETAAPLLPEDKKMEAIWKSEYSLAELVAPDKFKSYDELKKEFEKATGERQDSETRVPRESAPEPTAGKSTKDRFADVKDDTPAFDADEPAAASTNDDDDADLDFYRNLLK